MAGRRYAVANDPRPSMFPPRRISKWMAPIRCCYRPGAGH